MTVGYDRSWIAPRDCLIATLACGFADGYSRSHSSKGVVGIRGKLYTVAGKVCMDMLMVDLGDPAGCDVEVGDYATLFGEGGRSLRETAESLGTAQSDVTCPIARRAARRYVCAPDGWEPGVAGWVGERAGVYPRDQVR